MPDWVTYAIGLFILWFIVDQSARIYLMYNPREDYKEDRTQDPENSYREEKEAEAVEFLSRYRWGRWLLKHAGK